MSHPFFAPHHATRSSNGQALLFLPLQQKKEKKIDKLSHQQIQFHFSSCTSQTLGSTMVATQSPQLGCCGTEPLRCTYYRSHFSLPNRIRIHRGTNRVFAVATEPKPNRTGGSSNSAKSPPLKAVNGVSTVNLLV